MTTQQKNKAKSIFEVLYKVFVLGGVGAILILAGAYKQEVKQLTFETIEDKVRTIDHVNESLSPIDLHDLQEHIHNPDFHMSKSAKDSVYVTRREFEELYGRTAVQVYQINKKLDNLQVNEQ